MQASQCIRAAYYRQGWARMSGTVANPNFPDTPRYTIREANFTKLKDWFFALRGSDPELALMYPEGAYRFEVATSGSAFGNDVRDLKISPIVGFGASGPAVCNYHIEVVPDAT
jgi:hypothetical protein